MNRILNFVLVFGSLVCVSQVVQAQSLNLTPSSSATTQTTGNQSTETAPAELDEMLVSPTGNSTNSEKSVPTTDAPKSVLTQDTSVTNNPSNSAPNAVPQSNAKPLVGNQVVNGQRVINQPMGQPSYQVINGRMVYFPNGNGFVQPVQYTQPGLQVPRQFVPQPQGWNRPVQAPVYNGRPGLLGRLFGRR